MKLVLSILLLGAVFVLSSLFELQMLQQNSYNGKHKFWLFFIGDVKNHFPKYLYSVLASIFFLLLNTTIAVFILEIIVLLAFVYNRFFNYVKHNEKLPLKYTARLKRIMFFDYLLYLLLQIVLHNNLKFLLGISMLYITFNCIVLMIIVVLLTPYEMLVFNHYKKLAMNKLAKMNALKIIGITGSFGKTSTKLILDSILKVKYKGFVTPASFNTPNGILKTINGEETIFNDYFVCEMGARKNGEIKELCDLVHPSYAILTSIGPAHLESFKSIENIQKTKFELIESLPINGIAILNKDDAYQRSYVINNKCNIIWIGIENDADVMASNIRISNSGTTFDVKFKGEEQKFTVSTILLGEKNIYNVLGAIALAYHLGMSFDLIKKGVKDIRPIPHRLELKQSQNITILDDAYNANPNGAQMALKTLQMMEGVRIVITPGMVEMGKSEKELNYAFGRQMATCADKVYLIGEKRTKPIYDGLIKENFKKENIIILNKFKDAYNDATMKSGNKKITILIENDLPDSYMEE